MEYDTLLVSSLRSLRVVLDDQRGSLKPYEGLRIL